MTVVDIPENKKIEIRTVPLVPMHELREVKGTFDELMDRRNYEGTAVMIICMWFSRTRMTCRMLWENSERSIQM